MVCTVAALALLGLDYTAATALGTPSEQAAGLLLLLSARLLRLLLRFRRRGPASMLGGAGLACGSSRGGAGSQEDGRRRDGDGLSHMASSPPVPSV